MLKTSVQFRYQVERFVDAVIAFVALTLAILLRRDVMLKWQPDLFPIFDFWPQAGWLYLLLIVLWVFLLDVFGLYTHKSAQTPAKTGGILLKTNLVGIMLAFFLFYIATIKNIPRVLIFLYAGIDFLLMYAKESALRYLEPRWQPVQRALLVGRPEEFNEFVERMSSIRNWNVEIIGLLLPASIADAYTAKADPGRRVPLLRQTPVLGTTHELGEILHEHSVDYVILSPGKERFEDIQETITVCETEGVETWLLGSFFKTSVARASVDEFQDIPMLTFSTTPILSWSLLLKRIIDIIGAAVLIALSAPVMAGAAIAIRLTSPGPIIYKQRRCTIHGREFWMYKFRTMVSEADQLRAELESRNEVGGPVFKMWNDPRITRVGKWMRRYSIDELPQLFNVLKGDMSLVGPRPPIPSEVKNYEDWQRRRLSMRPGITCLWQTAGRNEVAFEDWMRLDLQYIDNWSLGLDFRILLRTPLVVLKGTGI